MHPLLELLLARPQLLADHAQAYAALFTEEMVLARVAWQRQAVCWAIIITCLLSACILAGVAAM